MEKNREKNTHKTRRKTICLTPKPVRDNAIKPKIQHTYIKDKVRPDEEKSPKEYIYPTEISPLERLSRTHKMVHMASENITPEESSDIRVSSEEIDFTEMQLRKKIADADFSSNIKHFMKRIHGSDSGNAVMDEEVTNMISELSVIDPDSGFKKILNREFLEEKEEKHGKDDFIYSLSALEASAVLAVFDKAIDQLSILKYLLPPNPTKVKAKYRSVEERYGAKRFGSMERDEYQLDCDHPADLSLMRLQEERAFLQDTLTRTSRSLTRSNSFWPIRSTVEDLRTMAKENLTMAWKWPITSLRMVQAREVLKQNEVAMSIMPIKHSVHMQEMQEGMSNTQLMLQIREKYVERWEAARMSQHRIILHRGETKLRKKIMEIGLRTVHEIRVGEEVDRYVEFEEKRVLSLLAAWEQRHEEELEKIGTATISSKLTLDVAQYHTQTAFEEYENRQTDIDRWHKKRENQAQRVEAALRIQVWWRTILYRRRLLDALHVIKNKNLEKTKFGKKIVQTAISMRLIAPPPPVIVEEKRGARGRKAEKKEDPVDIEAYATSVLRRLKVSERLALARKSVVREQLERTKKLLALQSLWGRAEEKKRRVREAERRRMLLEHRRRIRMAAKLGRASTFQSFDEIDQDKYSGGSDEIPLSTDRSRMLRRQASRPHLPGIYPRFSTPLTDLLSRASFADKVKRMRGSYVSEGTVADLSGSESKIQMKTSFGSVDRKTYDNLLDYLKDRDV